MSVSLIHPSERCLPAKDFCTIARALDSVVHHPPCVFIKLDAKGNFLGWAISVFSQAHREAIYLVSQGNELELFPDVHEAMLFLNAEGIFTFNVSSAG
ncbi:hypothetical protein EK599_08450 [Vibrio sp. T187]|uniref:hypothetical protein n=1 Tax=Vibrio TaxID=662 RepID=UPI0010CA0DAE|nr:MULTISPECIES: hypothetical protein [Vibrio]MBW3695724.1 hypothetical protein [Vibrio sp. T187]